VFEEFSNDSCLWHAAYPVFNFGTASKNGKFEIFIPYESLTSLKYAILRWKCLRYHTTLNSTNLLSLGAIFYQIQPRRISSILNILYSRFVWQADGFRTVTQYPRILVTKYSHYFQVRGCADVMAFIESKYFKYTDLFNFLDLHKLIFDNLGLQTSCIKNILSMKSP